MTKKETEVVTKFLLSQMTRASIIATQMTDAELIKEQIGKVVAIRDIIKDLKDGEKEKSKKN